METTKNLIRIGEALFFVLWGVNLIDIVAVPLFKNSFDSVFSLFEQSIKLGLAIIGIVFAFLRMRQALKRWKHDNKMREITLKIEQYKLTELEDQAFFAREKQKARIKREINKAKNGTKES